MKIEDIRLAIVVPVSNHCDLTEDCLTYLYEHTEYKPARVIVVNDGSTDSTGGMLDTYQKIYPTLLRVTHPTQQGFAKSCNDGMKLAKGLGMTHILLLNNDIEVWQKDWLGKLLEPFEENDKLIVGVDYINYNSATIVDDEIVPYVGGWCMVFPVKLLDKIGMLDTTFSPAFYEDVEFCARAADADYQLLGLGGEVGIHHLYGRTVMDGRVNVNAIHVEKQPIFQEKIRALRRKQLDAKMEQLAGTHWAFYCPGNMVFDDTYLEGEGLGGAESALVQFTRALSSMGAQVFVFNDCPHSGSFSPAKYREGRDHYTVHYRHLMDEIALQAYDWDVFVLFRVTPPAFIWDMLRAKAKIFWTCDQCTTMDWRENIFPFVNRTVAISEHHRQFLIDFWGADPETTIALPLGVTRADFETQLPKIPGRLIYPSVPYRGLQYLAEIFTHVKEEVPTASLVITGDYTLWGAPEPYNEEFKALFAGMEDVHFLGKVPRRRLIQEMKQAELHVYPCDYYVEIPYTGMKVEGECFCVASLECQAAGTPTIATPNGALKTTVAQGDSGYLIRGHYPGEPAFTERFVNVVVDLLRDQRDTLAKMSEFARRRALRDFAWPTIALRWLDLVQGITPLRKKGEAVSGLWEPDEPKQFERILGFDAKGNLIYQPKSWKGWNAKLNLPDDLQKHFRDTQPFSSYTFHDDE